MDQKAAEAHTTRGMVTYSIRIGLVVQRNYPVSEFKRRQAERTKVPFKRMFPSRLHGIAVNIMEARTPMTVGHVPNTVARIPPFSDGE